MLLINFQSEDDTKPVRRLHVREVTNSLHHDRNDLHRHNNVTHAPSKRNATVSLSLRTWNKNNKVVSKMKNSKHLIRIAGLLAASLIASQAQTISLWNFNSLVPDASTATGILTPSAGSGTVSLIGGVTSTFAAGSLGDPASIGTDNSGLNLTGWAAQGTGSGARGLQVAVSTAGFSNIRVSLDFRESGTVSRFFQLQASVDGSTFNNVSGGIASFGAVNNNTNTAFTSAGLFSNTASSGSQAFVESINYTFAPGSTFENNPNFAFRWVAVFAPADGANYISANAGTTAAYATTGTARFDMVSVTSVPEPSAFALGALGISAMIFRKRLVALR
jgi:hypothetical protein